MNPYSRLIVRLDGDRLAAEPEFYVDLVKKGVAGFIVFGGEIEKLREGLRYLQDIANSTLIIASDLEQGLGQQVGGGTVFPSAMAMASEFKKDPSKVSLIEQAFRQIAREALYCGINTIFAPVMDIQSNPMNPIISIRSFGDGPEIVSELGSLFIKVLNEEGVLSCAKHFPGHGDTEVDSHHGLPVVRKSMAKLLEYELIPFKKAIDSGVSMIMTGHILVPAIDPERPVSISQKGVKLLREIGFDGIIITDAINMGALSSYGEVNASELALLAGTDLILHPSRPDEIATRLQGIETGDRSGRLAEIRGSLKRELVRVPDFERARYISKEIYRNAIDLKGEIPQLRDPLLLILDEELRQRADPIINTLGIEHAYIRNEEEIKDRVLQAEMTKSSFNRDIILAVFSRPSAFKKDTMRGFREILSVLAMRAQLVLSFGNPFVFAGIDGNIIFVYDDTPMAQITAGEFLKGLANELRLSRIGH